MINGPPPKKRKHGLVAPVLSRDFDLTRHYRCHSQSLQAQLALRCNRVVPIAEIMPRVLRLTCQPSAARPHAGIQR